jgi:hypothetical protein
VLLTWVMSLLWVVFVVVGDGDGTALNGVADPSFFVVIIASFQIVNNAVAEDGGVLSTMHKPILASAATTAKAAPKPRKPRVPQLSGGGGGKKRSGKRAAGKKKKRKKKKKKDTASAQEVKEATVKISRKPAVPRLSRQALESSSSSSASPSGGEEQKESFAAAQVREVVGEEGRAGMEEEEKKKKTMLEKRRKGAKIYIAQQKEKRYQLKLREQMTKELKEKKR